VEKGLQEAKDRGFGEAQATGERVEGERGFVAKGGKDGESATERGRGNVRLA
jgi:hypothetical protein